MIIYTVRLLFAARPGASEDKHAGDQCLAITRPRELEVHTRLFGAVWGPAGARHRSPRATEPAKASSPFAKSTCARSAHRNGHANRVPATPAMLCSGTGAAPKNRPPARRRGARRGAACPATCAKMTTARGPRPLPGARGPGAWRDPGAASFPVVALRRATRSMRCARCVNAAPTYDAAPPQDDASGALGARSMVGKARAEPQAAARLNLRLTVVIFGKADVQAPGPTHEIAARSPMMQGGACSAKTPPQTAADGSHRWAAVKEHLDESAKKG